MSVENPFTNIPVVAREVLGEDCVSMRPLEKLYADPYFKDIQLEFYVPVNCFSILLGKDPRSIITAQALSSVLSNLQEKSLPPDVKVFLLLAESVSHMGQLLIELLKLTDNIHQSSCYPYTMTYGIVTDSDTCKCKSIIVIMDKQLFTKSD